MQTVECGVQIVRITDEAKIAGSDYQSKLAQTLEVLIPELLRRTQGAISTSVQPSDYKVLIARQATDLSMTLKDLQLQPGDYIFLMQPAAASVQLRVYPANRNPEEGWLINEPSVMIGRRDDERGIIPRIDLTGWLKHDKSISRQQAELHEKNGNWEIMVYKEAKGVMYLDQTRMEPGHAYPLKEGDTVIFGNLQDPDLRLCIEFFND